LQVDVVERILYDVMIIIGSISVLYISICTFVLLLGKIALRKRFRPQLPISPFLCRLSHSCTLLRPFDWLFTIHAIWQVNLQGPMTRCVRWGSLTPRPRGDLGGGSPNQKCNCLLMIHQGAAPISDFTSYQMTSITCYY